MHTTLVAMPGGRSSSSKPVNIVLLIAGLGTLRALSPHRELISEAVVLKSIEAEGNEDFFEFSFAP